MKLNGVLNGITQYLREKGLFEECQAWFKIQLESGGNNGLQGNGKEGREDADEAGKNGSSCCGKGACCKEGKEEAVEPEKG